MKPTPNPANIADILSLALPFDTIMVAGTGHTRRNVGWAVLLTSWDDLELQVAPGDLVIIPPSLPKELTLADMLTHFKILAELSAAAVLMFAEVPPSLATFAAELELPLLIAPLDSSVREAHRSIVALLVDQQTAVKERGMQLYRQLSEMSREGQGIEAMTDLMSKLTGKIIVIQDKRLEIRAITYPRDTQIDIEALSAVIIQRDLLPAVLRNRKAAAKARQSHWQQLLLGNNIARLISPIISGDRARGYVSVIGDAGELDILDNLTAEQGAAACALEMAKAKAVSEAKKAFLGSFLEGLLIGSLPQKEIERLEQRLDHDTKQPHAVLAFAWDEAESAASIRRLETSINWVLSNHKRSALVYMHGKQHVCIFQALKDAEDLGTAHELARRILSEVEAEYPKTRIIGGMSGPAHNLSEWPRVYNEALQAMQLSQRLHLSQVVEFNSLGVYRLLSALENIPTVQSFTEQIIGPLAAYDHEHKGSLVQTVEAYFTHHGNISKTAEALFVHRNTLLYRLDRIQELSRHDLNNADARLAFHLALKLWQLRPQKSG